MTVASRHPTSAGTIVYGRCACGLLHTRLETHADTVGTVARASTAAEQPW